MAWSVIHISPQFIYMKRTTFNNYMLFLMADNILAHNHTNSLLPPNYAY